MKRGGSYIRESLVMQRQSTKSESTHSLIKVTPEVHERIKELSSDLNRLPINVASELLEWALERVEIVE